MSEDEEDEDHDAFMLYCERRRDGYRKIFGIEEPKDRLFLAPRDLALMCWFGGGVFQFPPNGPRKHWHYATEAISQPEDPDEALAHGDPSYAFELVISTKTRCKWAPSVLMDLARYYFGESGRPFRPFEAIPCGGPLVANTDTKLTYLISVTSRDYEPVIQLPGVTCTLVHMVGVTEDEIAPVLEDGDLETGIRALHQVLCNHDIGSCSIPERPSLADSPGFEDEWKAELARLRI